MLAVICVLGGWPDPSQPRPYNITKGMQMASSMRELRIKARKLGATNVREMDEDELQEYIDENSSGSNGKSRKAKKRGPGRPKGSKNKASKAKKAKRVVEEDYEDDEEEEVTPRRRGRPKGSKNKTTAKRGPGHPKGSGKKASTSKAKRSSGKVGRPAGSGTGTRVTLKSKINWNKRFDFREGSTSQYILNQVRKSAKRYDDTDDIREDVIEKLENKLNKVDELTFNNRTTGRAHKGDAALKMLRYRVSRTMLDYAIETGQHDGSGNGGSTTKSKPAAKRGRPKGSTTKKRGPGRPRKVVEEDYEDDEDEEEEAPRRRGRPKGSKNKTKRGPGRPKGSTNKVKRGPGRPKGSKNKSRR